MAPAGVKVGLLHPGEMGTAVGAALRAAGHEVLWASQGRSAATAERATAAGLEDSGTAGALAARAETIVSLCPPHAALDVADSMAGFAGVYVDANAVSPATARRVAGRFDRYVDGSVIGPPPRTEGTTRLYLSGREAPAVASLLAGTVVEAVVLEEHPFAASALKMAFAAWTKGGAALLLATRETARAEGVEDALLEEWRRSLPELEQRAEAAARSAAAKGWRWVAEMEEIAATFAAAGQPDGFHRAAAEVFETVSRRSRETNS